MDSSQFDVQRMDHLGLVSGFCKEIGLEALVNERMPKLSHKSHISNGTLLVAMMLNGLGFVSRTLHMYPEYFADKPLKRLLGAEVEASHINDDVMGRFLDALYEEGVSGLYQDIAVRVVEYLKLPCRSLNLDTTSFHLDGAYEQDINAKSIRITRGYSRDHRPDLNQVVLSLITENQAGIPLHMQACSGNAQDTETFRKTVKAHIKSLRAAYQNTYFIADAALYAAETIKTLADEGQLFITRVPQKLKEARALLSALNNITWTPLQDGYAGSWHDSCYGGINQRWLLLRSTHAKEREKHILDALIYKKTQASMKSFKKLCRQSFACESDAYSALEKWIEEQAFIKICDGKVIQQIKRSRRGRPGSNDEYRITFHITGHIASCLQLKEEAAQTTGLFILATNDLSETLSMQFMLDEYKSQQAVERGFRFLKSPDFLTSSLFLKKPERIESLLMIMTCCLMIYAGIEHLIRKKLAENNAQFPDMKKKPTQRPTARWVFFCFQGISVVVINKHSEAITNMVERHKIILDVLGKA
ncbi:TPA: IS1634 family transposase, partial [Legionella pneumophila]|nr:IS1634 family transposase [Legionella pneumophila]